MALKLRRFESIDFPAQMRKHRVIAQIVEKRVKKHVEEKLPEQFKPRLIGPSSNWETFFRQQEAFEYARTKAKDLCVFAYESPTLDKEKGQRRYLATSLPGFWHYYSQLNESQRYHYEVIPEGAVCKLYFDLEFNKEKNPGRNGVQMVHTLIKLQFGVRCSPSDVLDLDSSTSKKFSRHLIFQLSDVAFRDNIHAGRFVNYIFNLLLDIIVELKCAAYITLLNNSSCDDSCPTNAHPNIKPSSECNNKSTIKTDSRNTFSLIESDSENSPDCENQTQINLRNSKSSSMKESDAENLTGCGNKSTAQTCPRNFECFSLKEDEADATVRTDSERSVRQHNRHREKQLVMDSFTQEELESLVVQGNNTADILFCDTGVYTKNRNFRLYKSSKLGKNNPFELSQQNTFELPAGQDIHQEKDIFFSSLICNVRYTDHLKILTFELADSSATFVRRKTERTSEENLINKTDTMEGYTKTPYPEIDEFILNIITSDGHHGYIRRWSYFTHDELLVYDLARFRFCENIGREHHSNNVMLVVDMKRGVYYQKCHDPECRAQNFKSLDYKLPESVLPAHYFDNPIIDTASTQDEFDSDFEDEDCVQEVENMEKSLVAEDEGLSDVELLSATEDLEKSLLEGGK